MSVVSTIILTFVILLAVIAGMAIGVMNGRKPISGSCGGLGGGRCEYCGGGNCRRESEE